MSNLTQLHNSPVAAPVVHPAHAVAPMIPDAAQLDLVMLLGALTAFALVVLLIYRRDIARIQILMTLCLAAAASFALMRHELVLSFILSCLCICEFFGWRRTAHTGWSNRRAPAPANIRAFLTVESRFDRMFGPAGK